VFKRGSRMIIEADEVISPSDMGQRSAWSVGRKWHAYLEETPSSLPYHLLVADRDGVIKQVAVGSYSQCEGNSLLVTGWLDERYLVYRNGSFRFFIYDAEKGTTANLFGEEDTPQSFSW
jgi:hypothetical protein